MGENSKEVSTLKILSLSLIYTEKQISTLFMLSEAADQHSMQMFQEASGIVPNHTADSTDELVFPVE